MSANNMSADEIARALHRITHTSNTGVTARFEYDQLSGQQVVRRSQAVDEIIDYNTKRRNEFALHRSAGLDDTGIIYMADIPLVVIDQIKQKYGVDGKNPSQFKEFFAIIDRDYPNLKAVDMSLAGLVK